jgi:16S rRNA (guanine527-N7)-methyltransferase
MSTYSSLLSAALIQNNLDIDTEALQKLEYYLELLHTWNRVFNLTTITEPRNMVYNHLIDSLVIAPYLQGTRFLDVGSGAGLPGIPLAILHPQQQWTLMDKNSKKTRFITQAVAELDLINANIIHSRSEDFHPALGFDNIVSRAFGSLAFFIETTTHLLKPQGKLMAMKANVVQEELNDIPSHFVVQEVIRLDIKGMDAKRHIILLSPKISEHR